MRLNSNDRQYINTRVNVLASEAKRLQGHVTMEDWRQVGRTLTGLKILLEDLHLYLAQKKVLGDEMPNSIEREAMKEGKNAPK